MSKFHRPGNGRSAFSMVCRSASPDQHNPALPKLHTAGCFEFGYPFLIMNTRAVRRAPPWIATPKNRAARCGGFIIPRKRDKDSDSPV
jgi:hypothetical protein